MLWEEPRKEPIPRSLRTELLLRCKGKCEECGLDFHKEGIRPHFHHKDGNPKNNKPSNLIVVCPNCHSKFHKWKTVKEEDLFGFVIKKRKLVAIKPEKRKTSTKKKKGKRRKRKRKTESLIPEYLL
jgi:5-methylcytosine-specific restriction endonuclease McrA